MKKNGFIMSTYVYILLVFFLLLLGTMLVVLNNTRLLANKIKENTDGNIDFNLILKGDKEIILKKDSEYIEPGYIATTFDGKNLDVNVMGEVNVNKLGEYDIIYIAEYKGVEKKIKRKVIVAENLDACTTGIEIWAPIPDEPPEPSEDNSKYEICGKEGIKIVIGKTKVLHPNYTPSNATNYNFEYSVSASSFVAEQAGYNTIRANYNGGSGSVTIKDTVSGKTGTCYFDVYEPAP